MNRLVLACVAELVLVQERKVVLLLAVSAKRYDIC